MKSSETPRALARLSLVWAALASSLLVAQAQLIVNNFDTASEVGQWRFDFGGVAHSAVWDSTRDANGNPASGSMRVDLTFNSTLGGNNKGAYTTDRWFPGINGAAFASLSFDLLIDPNSAPDAFGYNGYFSMAIRNTDAYTYVNQFGDNVRSADGWRHISVPLTAPDDAIRALTFQLYGGPSQNIDGDVIFNIDNIRFTLVPEPSTFALVAVAAAGLLLRRRRP